MEKQQNVQKQKLSFEMLEDRQLLSVSPLLPGVFGPNHFESSESISVTKNNIDPAVLQTMREFQTGQFTDTGTPDPTLPPREHGRIYPVRSVEVLPEEYPVSAAPGFSASSGGVWHSHYTCNNGGSQSLTIMEDDNWLVKVEATGATERLVDVTQDYGEYKFTRYADKDKSYPVNVTFDMIYDS
ncbi:MAG: hypothetical protein LBN39_07645 [Planctomycetaceae bacterium]|jgi:hypothetical protein|nr:hypothetical protein [Planctomycetaceae bacterium]